MTKRPNPSTISRKVQHTRRMRSLQMASSLLARLFGHRFGLAQDVKTDGFRHGGSCWSARRCSARFGPPRWCAKLRQNPGHRSTHVSRSHPLAMPFSGTVARLTKQAGHHQLIPGTGHDQTPALELFGSAHVPLRPQQVLFEKARAVFVGEAQPVTRCDFGKRKLLLPDPDKPAFTWIASGSACSFPQHAKNRHFHLAGLPNRQMLPRLHHTWLAAPIGATPRGTGSPHVSGRQL